MSLDAKFRKLSTDNAPGQELRHSKMPHGMGFHGPNLEGTPVDFSHGDVNAFEPTPGALDLFHRGVELGGEQAYTEYRGAANIRDLLAPRLAAFTGAPVDAHDGLIVTPGTQGALFLAVACTVDSGDKVAIVQPDYFANRKLVDFFGGKILPVPMQYATASEGEAGLDLGALEAAFSAGARLFLFSNPNNPTGAVYSEAEITQISALAQRFGATVIVDQLYSRLRYSGTEYTHLRAKSGATKNVVTIMGPSKTESLSGYRLGVAFGPAAILDRMEKLQAIVSLRAPGYCQAVLRSWFDEPDGWLENRIERHQAIRNDLLEVLRNIDGVSVATPRAGSYLFPRLPKLSLEQTDFVRALRIQAGVTVTPGNEFSDHAGDSVRLNFSQKHYTALVAANRLAMLVERYRA